MTPRRAWAVITMHRRARELDQVRAAAAARMAHAKADDWKKYIQQVTG